MLIRHLSNQRRIKMELNEIIDKKELVKLDVLTVFIYSGISRLHDKKIPIKIWKKLKEQCTLQ